MIRSIKESEYEEHVYQTTMPMPMKIRIKCKKTKEMVAKMCWSSFDRIEEDVEDGDSRYSDESAESIES